MNFHDRHGLASDGLAAAHRYEPAPREHHPERGSASERLRAAATAPLLGSRFVFPRRFDRAVETMLRGGDAGDITPEHALWYFGETLHLDVNPARLRRRVGDYVRDRGETRWMGESFLDAADWSAVLAPIDQSPIHREMTELVAAGRDYRDTRAYRTLVEAIRLRRPSKRNGGRLESLEDIEAYLHYCYDLIKSTRKRGIVRHRVSGAFHRLRLKHRDSRSPVLDSTERDIGVAIAADGELVRHLGGKHRTAIAQALGLASIPVELRLVHVEWLAGEMRRTGLPAHRALAEGVRALFASAPPAG